MKNIYSKLFSGFFLFLIIAGLPSCKKDTSPANVDDTVAKSGIALSGSQQVPAVSTPGTGLIDVAYSPTSKVLNYNLRWSNLSSNIVGMHIHGPADRGVNATVLVPITNFQNTTSGQLSGKVIIDNSTLKESDLLAGKWYINIHTANNSSGEIRGQIEF